MFVYEKPGGGGWPDPEKWMRGTNNSTGETGDFPGTYCEYVEEVSPSPPPPPVAERSPTHAPAPPASNGESAPPVPPRRPKTSLRKRGGREGEGRKLLVLFEECVWGWLGVGG